MPELTPPQTIGPFFHPSLVRDAGNEVVGSEGPAPLGAERIRIEGRVCDGDGAPVDDAMVEIWQADPEGRYRHPLDPGGLHPEDGFVGFGRSATDADGRFWFQSVKPGRVAWPGGGWQAPHVNVLVFARGLLDRLVTRLYFEDESDNAGDPVLSQVAEDRQPTLIARRSPSEGGATYRLDIVLQGENETVFFDS